MTNPESDETDRIVRSIELLACSTLIASGRSRLEALAEIDDLDKMLGLRDARLAIAEIEQIGRQRYGGTR